MFSGPAASRGKKNKGAVDDGRDNAGDPRGKRNIQKATKAQRKQGGMKRGGQYDVEDVGSLYMQTDQSTATAPAPRFREPVECSTEGDDTSSSESEDKEAHEQVSQSEGIQFDADAPGGDDEEVRSIKDGIRKQLREWAFDPGLTLDEQKRLVRQLMAQWHPDKNRHIGAVATGVFQFIQDEVQRLLAEMTVATDTTARKEAEYQERRAQRMADKNATAAALTSAREEKKQRKKGKGGKRNVEDAEEVCETAPAENAAEWSLVVGHGPATTPYLRPWPRSHITMTASPLAGRDAEIFLFGGEAYNGRELTFYSDLYSLNLDLAEASKTLPWEKLYSSVPTIPGPEPRSSHQVVTFGSHLYLFGGEWSSRDQRRYRQFGDLWSFEATGGPGARWQHLRAGKCPVPRSGHRMAATSAGNAIVFGGFSEDKRRRAAYLSDVHILPLQSMPGADWSEAELPPGKRSSSSNGPGSRSGCLLWTDASDATYVFGGARPRKTKKGRCTEEGGLDILEDLWRARFEQQNAGTSSSSSAKVFVQWESLATQGEGPGTRSGLCQCAVSKNSPERRIVFGGVRDVGISTGSAADKSKMKEVALFHQDVFLLDCDAVGGPLWTRLWPQPGDCIPKNALGPASLPSDVRDKGGGVDAIVLATNAKGGRVDPNKMSAPRGRMASACTMVGNSLWIFGGSCEAGPRQEVTLDDLWRLDFVTDNGGNMSCGGNWECVLPLSDRATMWFDSESESDDEEEMEMDIDPEEAKRNAGTLMTVNANNVLSKKQQKQEDKKARTELKRERQQEKCEDKSSKRELKKEQQRVQAQVKGKNCKN